MFRYLYIFLVTGGVYQSASQNLNWLEVKSDIKYLNSQRASFLKVEEWVEGTRVESILMDSIYITYAENPPKAELTIYHSGSFDPSELNIPLKQIDSITTQGYILNLHLTQLDPPVYSFRYRKMDVFQGNEHVLHYVVERFQNIVNFYKTNK